MGPTAQTNPKPILTTKKKSPCEVMNTGKPFSFKFISFTENGNGSRKPSGPERENFILKPKLKITKYLIKYPYSNFGYLQLELTL